MRGWLEVFGGVGLFLMGMALMTEGLRAVAGNTIRQALARFTKGPVSGAVTGALATGLIHSSGAVTVMAVGFVGAGLMSFQQSLGIILGANVGTTATGWLVALLGVRISPGLLALPVLFAGALLRRFGRDRTRALGDTLAGFGMLFFGISVLQTGMQQFGEIVTPESFPPNTFSGRVYLLFTGLLATLITQSSTAGIATTVTALHGGYLSLAQAAALAVGMDVGTTATALLASVGGNVNARRTALSHVIFNLITAVFAFLSVPYYVQLWDSFLGGPSGAGAELGLVVFHSLFNLTGVICMLPFTRQFAEFIIWLTPAGDDELERRLEPSLLTDPRLALQSVHVTLAEIVKVVFSELAMLLRSAEPPESFVLSTQNAEQAVQKTAQYLERIRISDSDRLANTRQTTAYHLVDHLQRLLTRAAREHRLHTVRMDPTQFRFSQKLSTAIDTALQLEFTKDAVHALESVWQELDRMTEPYRQETIEQSIREGASSRTTLDRMDSIRWLRRLAYHTWRIVWHLTESGPDSNGQPVIPPSGQESDPNDE